MYTTKQFDKDVEELRRLIKMCETPQFKTVLVEGNKAASRISNYQTDNKKHRNLTYISLMSSTVTFSGVFSLGAPLTKVGAAKLMPTEFVCCGQHTFVEVSVEGVKYYSTIECE